MSFYGYCEGCGNPVEDPQQPAYPVTGWEVGRTGGGANAIRLRARVPNRVRHVSCLPSSTGNTQDGLFSSTTGTTTGATTPGGQ
jgi:hypothetical protein